MTKPIITIHNVETGEIVEREMNAEEYEQWQADQLAWKDEQDLLQAKATAKAELLTKLGLTAEEAALLLG
jgi:hypothetical protein